MSGQNTEADILSNMPGMEDSGNETTQGTTETTQDTAGGGNGQDTTSTFVDGQRDTGSQTDTTRQQPGQQQRTGQQPDTSRDVRRHDGLIERPNARDPRSRDIIDPATGQVVALAGRERRYFEAAQKAQRQTATMQHQIEQLQRQTQNAGQQYAAVEAARKDFGLTPELQLAAFQVMRDFQRDPVQTVSKIIEEMRSKGHTLPFMQQAGALDMASIARLMDEKMKPLTSMQERQQADNQAQQQARQTLDTFLGAYEDANANLDVIGQLMQKDPRLTLEGAYIRMVRWAADNGLDYTQPLGPQIQASNDGQQTGSTPQGQTQRRPLPNGRSATAGTTDVSQAGASFGATDSWESILRQTMADGGYNMQ